MPKTVEEVRALAAQWTAPISEKTPSGDDARTDARYAEVSAEVAKLNAPSMQDADWNRVWGRVIASGGELLAERSKDFLVAARVAYALTRTENLDGLLKGIGLLLSLMDDFWSTMFPKVKRLRARANALGWFIERAAQHLEGHTPIPGDRERLEDLAVALDALAAASREKFGALSPATGPLRELFKRMLIDAGPSQAELDAKREADAAARAAKEAARVKEAPRVEAAPAPPTAPDASQVVAITTPTAGAPAPPDDLSRVGSWLSSLGATVSQAGGAVRRASDTAPLAYRMVRNGLYLHLLEAPPADPSGRTRVPAPSPKLRAQIESIARNQLWAPLLEETESALSRARFWLDLHRHSAQALAGLGPAHQPARDEVLRELGLLLRRLPTLQTLRFADGTPFADEATLRWIDDEVLASARVLVAPRVVAPVGDTTDPVAEALTLATAGNIAEAIAMLQSRAEGASSGSARARYRVGIGQVFLLAGRASLAKGVFEALEREVSEHKLAQWEPALAAEVAEGLVRAHRSMGKKNKSAAVDVSSLFERVCWLDPSAALRLDG